MNQTGGTTYPAPDLGWGGEIALDIDMVSAICPRCKILLVEANSASVTDLGTAVNTAVALGAQVVSNSYGGDEFGSETSWDTSYLNHPGVAITFSSGDWGYGVQYPAASPSVIAVGGTTLARDGSARGWTESAWGTPGNHLGAGSGCSDYEPKPAWQTDASCSRRMVSDVSAVADPATGVASYDSGYGGWSIVG